MSVIFKVLRTIAIFILAILVIVGAFLSYCAFDKREVLDALPSGQKVFCKTEKFYDATSPILELRAADILFADPQFSGFRGAFMNLRQAKNLQKPFIRFALNRKVAASLYEEDGRKDFICVADLSFVSAVTRLSPILAPKILPLLTKEKFKNISYKNDSDLPFYFEIASENSSIYLAPYKNLLIISNTIQKLKDSYAGNHKSEYSQEEVEVLCKKRKEPFCIIADAKELAQTFLDDKTSLNFILPMLKEYSKSVVTFSLDDSRLKMNAALPLEKDLENSTLPAMFSKFPDRVQYYTILNAGSLPELKQAVFPVLEQSGNDVEKKWQKADSLCQTFFSLTLEELLFSWSGSEFSVFGIEGAPEPVFAIQVKDEKQRQEIFDTLLSSIVLKENSSLLVGGMRLPYIDMPNFLRSLLKLFNVELPRPYYLVKDGFLYMSESPQNLAAVYEASQTGNLLAAQKRWQDLSKDMDVKTSAALYYNLARSVPFFLKKQNTITDILSLYNIGRADLAIKDKALTFSLNALSVETNDPRLLPGFPFETKGDSDGKLIAEDGKKCGAIFWTEDNSSIHSLELSTFRQESIQIEKLSSIAAAKKSSSSKGVLWAVTDDGEIYLLTRDLKVIDGYPKVTGIRPSAPCAVPAQNELLIPCANGKLYHLKEDSGQEFIFDDATFKSAPTCLDGYAAIYNKGFLGSIYFAKNGEWNQDKFFNIDQIAFGSPCLIKDKKGECLAAFITQNGAFYLFNLDTEEVVPGFPIETNSLFFSNVVYSNGYFFALSADASLYRIDFNGDFIALKIPDAQSAEHGTICAIPKGVAVCADKNIVWAWTNEMEIIGGFPVAGFGTPVIAEANGDRKPDCFVLSRDKKLYAWNGASLSISK